MRIIKATDYNDMSRKAANIIAAQVQLKPDCVLGLATGSTPIGTYKELVAAYENGDLDFSKVTTKTFILWGKKDTTTPPRQATAMYERLPNAELKFYANHLMKYLVHSPSF